MKYRWLSFLILGALTVACSTTPRELPTCEIPGPSPIVQAQLELPPPADPIRFTDRPPTATFDMAGMEELKTHRIAAATNKTVADKNAAALQKRNEEVEALIECARYQNIWVQVHEDDLRDEKQEHFKDNLVHQVVIGLGIIVGVAL